MAMSLARGGADRPVKAVRSLPWWWRRCPARMWGVCRDSPGVLVGSGRSWRECCGYAAPEFEAPPAPIQWDVIDICQASRAVLDVGSRICRHLQDVRYHRCTVWWRTHSEGKSRPSPEGRCRRPEYSTCRHLYPDPSAD